MKKTESAEDSWAIFMTLTTTWNFMTLYLKSMTRNKQTTALIAFHFTSLVVRDWFKTQVSEFLNAKYFKFLNFRHILIIQTIFSTFIQWIIVRHLCVWNWDIHNVWIFTFKIFTDCFCLNLRVLYLLVLPLIEADDKKHVIKSIRLNAKRGF